ncbi:MAG: amidohydrolase [Candidatus Diapherotrites archaeon]|uniref:Amidohydrolase n=1 Tax=Candidatus Iainarchaeum sp. TaxID=3101447 RepID=A0A8T3YRP9_9ARCH|nr:amidohydrolase [Candidatus Diapherotrites archaeon]
MLLKNCRYLVTQDARRRVLQGHDVRIDGDKIMGIGKGLKSTRGEEKLDCSRKIVMPGLVNTHTHLGMHSLRGKCDDRELLDWLAEIWPLERKLTPRQVKQNTLDGLREAIRFGTTAIYDSYRFPEHRLEAFAQTGVRGLLSSTVKDGETFKESAAFLGSIKNGKGLVNGAIAANAVYSCDEETLRRVIDYSDANMMLRRIHVGETRKDRFDTLQRHGKLAVEYLDSIGFLSQNCLLVHCIWITKGEIRKISQSGTKVSHNPVSNMKLASGGVMPLTEMLAEGAIVGLGTDSVASNNNLDMFEEMKTAALLHRHHKWDAGALSCQQVLDMATVNGAKCLGLEKAGSIEEGNYADIITLSIGENLRPMNDVVSNIVFAAQGMNVEDSIIGGNIVMRNGKLR